jgi:hypothetical protein
METAINMKCTRHYSQARSTAACYSELRNSNIYRETGHPDWSPRLVFQPLQTYSKIVPEILTGSSPSKWFPISFYANHGTIRRRSVPYSLSYCERRWISFPPYTEKHEIHHCHYAVSGYHGDEISNVNTFHELSYVVGHIRASSIESALWVLTICRRYVTCCMLYKAQGFRI